MGVQVCLPRDAMKLQVLHPNLQVLLFILLSKKAYCYEVVPNEFGKRSTSEEIDSNNIYEVFGNDGFLGLALFDSKEYDNVMKEENVAPYDDEFDDNEDTWIDVNGENVISKPISKRSIQGGDFIRLSKRSIDGDNIIRLQMSRSQSILPSTRPTKKAVSWKLRGGKRSPSGQSPRTKGGAFIRLSRVPEQEPSSLMNKRAAAMWKFRAGKRAYQAHSGDTWYYFRARK